MEKKNEHVYDILFKKLNYDDEQLGFKEMISKHKRKESKISSHSILSGSINNNE